MPTTWIEIADTAVKIGLGAVVTGLATLVNNRLSHAKNAEKDRHAKNVEILESVTLAVEEATHALLKHWSFIVDWARSVDSGREITKEREQTITDARTELFHLFKGLTNSEGRLLLLGYAEQQKKLREFGTLISEYHRYSSRNNDLIEVTELEAWRLKILQGREELYAVLNKAYRTA
ncbi:hypothetical protein HP546_19045 [Pseudomonas sp. CM25]|uniref:hypothetical protein n=1 Tax=Pseudomonas sp. CM25 TaxID=2738448 RepID=UPI0015551AC0|nr:hypothetical protein [Pseudomonas sp. CM25]NQD57436.1 hypothetical protein [Pseudomonas sp. CM25]